MINLKKLEFYLKFHEEIEDFLYKRCEEYDEAKRPKCILSGPMGGLQTFELNGDNIRVTFRFWECESENYELPLDILFEDDFCEKMKSRFEKIREYEAGREKVIDQYVESVAGEVSERREK